MSSGRKTVSDAELIGDLKFKIKELEHEVSTLRERLDGLRKAKNTLITKKEKEVVEVGFKKDPRYEAKIAELEKQIRELESKKQKEFQEYKTKIADLEKQLREREGGKFREIEELRRKHAAELAEALKARQKIERDFEEFKIKLTADMKAMEVHMEQSNSANACNHEDEIRKMKIRISSLMADNSALTVGNSELNDRVNSLVTDLSIKEAQWCEKEEQYKLKLKQNWGDKYGDWMAETERKIQELQDTNNMLRAYLHRSGTQLPSNMRPS